MTDQKPNQYTDNDKLLSNTISFMRFPLIALVVMIHCNIFNGVIGGQSIVDAGNYCIAKHVITFFTHHFSAIPIFFFISGYLFFHRADRFDLSVYARKLKNRVFSLLLPYIIWNLLYIAAMCATQLLLPDIMSGAKKPVLEWGIRDWLWAFWDMGKVSDGLSGPANTPFYFIQYLMVMAVFSPIVYHVLRFPKIGAAVMALIVTLWVFDEQLGWGDSIDTTLRCLSFYCSGAYLALHGVNWVIECKKRLWYILPVFLILLVLESIFYGGQYDLLTKHIAILVELPVFVAIAAMIVAKKGPNFVNGKVMTILSGSTFFVYGIHSIIASMFIKLYCRIFPLTSNTSLILCFFSVFVSVLALSFGVYYVLRRLFPRFTAFICGGRLGGRRVQKV